MVQKKKLHNLAVMLRRIRKAVSSYPKAALFELAERGFDKPFQQLVGCILSIRTRDEVSLPSALQLLKKAPTPEAIEADRSTHRQSGYPTAGAWCRR